MSVAYKKRKKAIKRKTWDFVALVSREDKKGTKRYKSEK